MMELWFFMLFPACFIEHSLAYTSVVQQLRMPGYDRIERGGGRSTSPEAVGKHCPHNKSGLISFAEVLKHFGDGSDVSIPGGSQVLLDASVHVGALTISRGAELVFADRGNLTLTAKSVYVEGALHLGSLSCPLQSHGITLTLTGVEDGMTYATHTHGSKGLVVADGGILEMHGKAYTPTWTRLAASATPGSTRLQLMDAVNWEVGQELLVVTTSWRDDVDSNQNEIRRIVKNGGSQVIIDRPLRFGHYGGQEYAAEVALLARTVVVQGDEQSESTKYGAHTMCTKGSLCHISGVKAFRAGQLNKMGRYPFHLHLMGDVQGTSYIQDCVVQHSFFRAITIHGTSYARISRNVAFDISGSAYYLEDGVEEHNLIEFNLAAFVQIIKPLEDYDNGGGQSGVTLKTEAGRLLPTDATAAGFYCTNAKNRWIGNSASGGFTGFHFPQVPLALGQSAASHASYSPEAHGLLEFDSNTAHSSGRHWREHGACIYVGGRLWEDDRGKHKYVYISGRYQPARMSAAFKFTNTKVFMCNKGVLWWGSHWSAAKPDLMLEKFEAHNVRLSSSMLGQTWMADAVISCRTGNSFAKDSPGTCEGFELYDTDMQTILVNVTWRGFNSSQDVAIMDMTHSNIFKQQGMFDCSRMQYEDTPFANRFRHVHRIACLSYHKDLCKNKCQGACAGLAGSSQTSTIVDADGSAVGWDRGPAILGADDSAAETAGETNQWWFLDANCSHMKEWGFYACPTQGRRHIVSLYLLEGVFHEVPRQIFSKRWLSSGVVDGQLFHFGHPERSIRLGLAGSPMITGPCCDIGWYMHLRNGALKDLTIFLDQMVPQDGLILATSYPKDAKFEVQRCMPDCSPVMPGADLQDVLQSPGTVFHWNGHVLFLKLLHEHNGYFEAGGVRQLQNGNRWHNGKGIRYIIRSSKGGAVANQLPPTLPGATPAPAPPPGTPASRRRRRVPTRRRRRRSSRRRSSRRRQTSRRRTTRRRRRRRTTRRRSG